MANKAGHRRFGTVRQRASGRWQARYPGPDGRLRSAPETFERKRDAERYLTLVEAAMAKGEWTDPAKVKVTVGDYAARWIEQRPGLRPRTVQVYRWTLKKHIDPYLGGVPLGRLTTAVVRQWRADLLADGVSSGMAAKAYRLLRAVLWTAVREDELLPRNPCRIPGADKDTPEERPHLTLTQVGRLMGEVPERYRVLVLLAVAASLRFGEITALRRQDIDLDGGVVRVRRQFVEVTGQGLVIGPPKSRAGVRDITIPASAAQAVRRHLNAFVRPEPDALVFTTGTGRPIRRGSFQRLVRWTEAVERIGMPGLHFHDLRHTGNMLAASSPTSTTRDLMARMGHDSMAAAIIYQHASQAADRAIAEHLDDALRSVTPAPEREG